MLTIFAFFHTKVISCFGCYKVCLASGFFICKLTWLVSEKVKFRHKTTCITVAHCMLCFQYEIVASAQKNPSIVSYDKPDGGVAFDYTCSDSEGSLYSSCFANDKHDFLQWILSCHIMIIPGGICQTAMHDLRMFKWTMSLCYKEMLQNSS